MGRAASPTGAKLLGLAVTEKGPAPQPTFSLAGSLRHPAERCSGTQRRVVQGPPRRLCYWRLWAQLPTLFLCWGDLLQCGVPGITPTMGAG